MQLLQVKTLIQLFGATLILLLSSSNLLAQSDDNGFVRDGRILVETGYNLVAGLSTSTGLTLFANSNTGETVTTLGFNGGYFLTENFALKLNLGIITSDISLTSIRVGGKYYFKGVVPVETTIGILSSGDDFAALMDVNAGYALSIADNIALEPAIGAIFFEGGPVFKLAITFAMFL